MHFLGGKPSKSLGAYPQHFDVCLMPYVIDDYTRYVYPLKMHEYLAGGRPVVSSPIRSVEDFKHVHCLVRTLRMVPFHRGCSFRGRKYARATRPAPARRTRLRLGSDWLQNSTHDYKRPGNRVPPPAVDLTFEKSYEVSPASR